MESLPNYDNWKLTSPYEGETCRDCGEPMVVEDYYHGRPQYICPLCEAEDQGEM